MGGITLTKEVSTASMGGAYEFVKTASANLREKDDHWNTTWGGLAAGAIIGLRCQFLELIPIGGSVNR